MKQPSSWAAAYVTPLFVLLVTIAVFMTGAPDAWAYPQYSQNKDATNCRGCHGDYRASPYVSLVDGVNWGDDLHDVHRIDMLGGDCDTCHSSGPRFPVLLDSSVGGDGLDPISCVGCHGRAENDSVANGGTCTVGAGFDCSPAAGLQQHHFNAGITICANCHPVADPATYTSVGEKVLPPFYANSGNDHPMIPVDSCNPDGTESLPFSGTVLGLDNDGDSLYDGGDPDCAIGCTTDEECDNGDFCDGAETCDLDTGECVSGTPVDVDDGVGCTDDSCDEVNDVVVHAPNDGLCDNGAFCDGSETCDAVNDCQIGTPVDVDDGVGCTDDSCDEANDVVVNTPNDASCDDGAFCNGSETCDAVDDCQFGTLPCDPATETCDEVGDICEPIGCQSDADCSDAAFCNGAETCNLGTGECVPGTPPVVNDGVGCTDDSCDEVNDVVVHAPNDGLCDNGAFCDGSETCDAVNDCQIGTPVDVDDGVGCTDDSCDEVNDVIVHTPNDSLCDNGEFCDGSETCDATDDCQAGTAPCDPATETCDEVGDICEPIGCQSDADCSDAAFCNGAETCNLGTGECVPGTPPVVNDGVGCTDDSCDEVNDVVVHAPNDGFCDNGLFCDGSESCDAVNDCQAGTPPVLDDGVGCTDDSCDEANDVVVNTPNDASCDDGAFCNGSETCDPVNDCQGGAAPCDPATETCDEAGDVCEPIGCQSDTECDNGMFCDGSETCDTGTGQCEAGTPPVVDDGVGCTDDSCDEANDVVVNTPNDASCDDGAFCNGSETCDAVDDCQFGTLPCDPATETCNEDGDICEPIVVGCQSDAECDNGMFCDGSETCDTGTGQCEAGTPPVVDDGVGCTDDSCDEANDVVVNAPNDANCDNGQFCDGAETCDAVDDCQFGTLPCDPATETCNEDGDICEPIVVGCQSDAECDNGMFCDGSETCDTGTGQCEAGTPPVVDDGVGCTDDSCDEANDVVVNAPNDANCDNGQYCDGAETCDAVDDCQAGTPPCDPATQTCNEDIDTCEGDVVQVMICHKPGQRSEHTLLVVPPAVRAHLRHGDFLGPCDD